MTRLSSLFLGVLTFISPSAKGADQLPGEPQRAPVRLAGGDVYTVSGAVIPGGQVLFEGGKIVAVGKDVQAPSDVKRVDVSGKRVYPGLFAAANDLGLVEVRSVRGTDDAGETGQINPNIRAEVAVNPDSELIPVARANGVLLNLTVPEGTLLPGTSAVMQLDGWTWQDMTVCAPAAVHVTWPRMGPQRQRRVQRQGDEEQQTPRADEQLKGLDQAFADARAYLAAKKAGKKIDHDARWEAMVPLLEGKVPLVVAADEVRQIRGAVAFAAREKVKAVILGGYDAPLCADLLKKYDVPVIVNGIHRLPLRPDSPYDEPFTVPARLREAGVKYAITLSHRFGGSDVRNLPYHAATAAAHGLPADEALKAITLYPAQILGCADRVGSLEVGKDATLFVADGDILETPTHVVQAFVQGRPVDLTSKHTQLYEKYREKYRRIGNSQGVGVGQAVGSD
jgi:imidazolonepropionase-like amidohydrolase